MYRQIKLEEQNVNCIDEILVEDYGLNFEWELWFDVDAYFGTETKGKDNIWVDFYTEWHREDNSIRGVMVLDMDKDSIWTGWDLTQSEQDFLREKMEAFVREHGYKSMEDMWRKETNE